jgi:galactose-1-phosphate uridylyltransferase
MINKEIFNKEAIEKLAQYCIENEIQAEEIDIENRYEEYLTEKAQEKLKSVFVKLLAEEIGAYFVKFLAEEIEAYKDSEIHYPPEKLEDVGMSYKDFV